MIIGIIYIMYLEFGFFLPVVWGDQHWLLQQFFEEESWLLGKMKMCKQNKFALKAF